MIILQCCSLKPVDDLLLVVYLIACHIMTMLYIFLHSVCLLAVVVVLLAIFLDTHLVVPICQF